MWVRDPSPGTFGAHPCDQCGGTHALHGAVHTVGLGLGTGGVLLKMKVV